MCFFPLSWFGEASGDTKSNLDIWEGKLLEGIERNRWLILEYLGNLEFRNLLVWYFWLSLCTNYCQSSGKRKRKFNEHNLIEIPSNLQARVQVVYTEVNQTEFNGVYSLAARHRIRAHRIFKAKKQSLHVIFHKQFQHFLPCSFAFKYGRPLRGSITGTQVM